MFNYKNVHVVWISKRTLTSVFKYPLTNLFVRFSFVGQNVFDVVETDYFECRITRVKKISKKIKI